MKRLNMVSLCAAAVCAAMLAGCGGSSSAPASSAAVSSAAASVASSAAVSAAAPVSDATDVTAQGTAILAANPISNPFQFADTNISLDLGLAADSYTGYYGVKSNDQGDAGTVIVIAAADGQVADVVSALEAYRDAQAAQLANYAEFADAQANMENAIIQSNDSIAVMAVPSNECADASALQAAVDTALS